MSKAEIAAELPKLSAKERRELARLIFELDEDAEALKENDRRANGRFLMLDAMEAEDAKSRPE
jgi:hypothetical protein